MRNKELTPEQLSSVPCPTCGVATGERCVLNSGALRSGSHVDRKFSAIEAVKGNRPTGMKFGSPASNRGRAGATSANGVQYRTLFLQLLERAVMARKPSRMRSLEALFSIVRKEMKTPSKTKSVRVAESKQ